MHLASFTIENMDLKDISNISSQVLLTKAGFKTAGINPNSLSFAGVTTKCWGWIGS